MHLPAPPAEYVSTREALRRVAVHVLARRRHEVTGRFGLRASPGGFGTPAFGPDHETVRVSGTTLLRERTGSTASTRALDLDGSTLAAAAALVGVDLSGDFSAGTDTPPVGDVDESLAVDAASAEMLGAWFAFGARALDLAVSLVDATAAPTVAQLWPEHFDIGLDLVAGSGRTNLGASPGDPGGSDLPYLYVGPWDDRRPGDADYWDAPFGATLGYDALRAADDPLLAATEFFQRGLRLLAAG